MSMVRVDISVSLDGFVAGPDPTLSEPLGEGGEELHEWVVATEAWRRTHGRGGGEPGRDSLVVEEATENVGATVMGRRMFSGGSGPWESDPNADAWWGDDPPWSHPVFVLTHHPREPVDKGGGCSYNFVTDGVQAALERAREAAGQRDVSVAGGADVVRQCLNAGSVDELQLHVVPVVLGSGRRLLEGVEPGLRLEIDRVVESPAVTHLRYRVG